jgi:putative flippase GtrA
MMANFHGDNAVRGIRTCAEDGAFSQSTAARAFMPGRNWEGAPCSEDSLAPAARNCKPRSEIRTSAAEFAGSVSTNRSSVNELGGLEVRARDQNTHAKSEKSVRVRTFVRWLRFNFVGGIGIFVQFVVLFLMKNVLHLDYLAATALAVEAAVVHNFIWHERYTWADRVQPSWRTSAPASGAKAQSSLSTLFAALKRCATQMLGSRTFTRFLRFNLTTGAVSIVGNLALMKVMVGVGQMNYLVANGIAIALCSLANFLVSEEWVFEETSLPLIPADERRSKP